MTMFQKNLKELIINLDDKAKNNKVLYDVLDSFCLNDDKDVSKFNKERRNDLKERKHDKHSKLIVFGVASLQHVHSMKSFRNNC